MGKEPEGPKSLFDFVFVAGVQDGESLSPFIEYRHPESDRNEKFAKHVLQFCFPDLDTLQKVKMKREAFSFVLTEQTGEKRWGYVRRIVREGRKLPQCFVVVSFVPCFSIFKEILDQMELRSLIGWHACDEFLQPISSMPLPQPGGSVQFSAVAYRKGQAAPAGDKEVYCFRRPDEDESTWDYVNLQPLLYLLDPDSIMDLFSSILLERRIIFVADKLSTLSTCVQAIVALLYPFSWQHIFIPVLPKSMISMCAAPMPFMVGVLRSCIPELNKISASMEEDTIAFDLDLNSFLSSQQGDYELIPEALGADVAKALAAACKIVKSQASMLGALKRVAKQSGDVKSGEMNRLDAQDLRNAFTGFFVDLIKEYRKYMPSTGAFRKEEFLEVQSPELRPLLEQFVQSQMFERFISERQARGLTNGKFENRVTMTLESRRGNSRRAKMGRFTMYEIGELTRDELTQTHQEMLRLEKEREREEREREKEREREIAAAAGGVGVGGGGGGAGGGGVGAGVSANGGLGGGVPSLKSANRRSQSSRQNPALNPTRAILAQVSTDAYASGGGGLNGSLSTGSVSGTTFGGSVSPPSSGSVVPAAPAPPQPEPLAVSDPTVVRTDRLKQGLLMKFPGHTSGKQNPNQQWREKFMTLTRESLRYSKSPVERGSEIAICEISDISVEAAHSGLRKDNVIMIGTAAGTYCFAASTMDEARAWESAINELRNQTRGWLSRVGKVASYPLSSAAPTTRLANAMPLPGIAQSDKVSTGPRSPKPSNRSDGEAFVRRKQSISNGTPPQGGGQVPTLMLAATGLSSGEFALQPFGQRRPPSMRIPQSSSSGSMVSQSQPPLERTGAISLSSPAVTPIAIPMRAPEPRRSEPPSQSGSGSSGSSDPAVSPSRSNSAIRVGPAAPPSSQKPVSARSASQSSALPPPLTPSPPVTTTPSSTTSAAPVTTGTTTLPPAAQSGAPATAAATGSDARGGRQGGSLRALPTPGSFDKLASSTGDACAGGSDSPAAASGRPLPNPASFASNPSATAPVGAGAGSSTATSTAARPLPSHGSFDSTHDRSPTPSDATSATPVRAPVEGRSLPRPEQFAK